MKIDKNDGWIEWGGGERPVTSFALVDLKFRNGVVEIGHNASAYHWENYNMHYDIIAYRLHKPDINSRANDDRLEQDLNECIGQGVDMPEWNGDGLPPAGSECEALYDTHRNEWVKSRIIAHDSGGVIGRWLDGDKCNELFDYSMPNGSFRPLRAEEGKAREKLAASLHIAAGASPIELNGIGPLYFELADAIISGIVFGTTFKENK